MEELGWRCTPAFRGPRAAGERRDGKRRGRGIHSRSLRVLGQSGGGSPREQAAATAGCRGGGTPVARGGRNRGETERRGVEEEEVRARLGAHQSGHGGGG